MLDFLTKQLQLFIFWEKLSNYNQGNQFLCVCVCVYKCW